MQRVPKNGKSFVVLFFKKGPLAFTLRELPSIRISISADARIGDEKAVALERDDFRFGYSLSS